MKKQIPKIAIIGRPNVGKSALFNRICSKRMAIVDAQEGVTRDRLFAETELFGRPFQVIDTGGIDPRSKLPFNDEIKAQAKLAIEEADSLIMVVDGQVGVLDLDEEVARLLLRSSKPVCLAVNKMDDQNRCEQLWPFYSLGIQPVIPISCAHNWQIAELLEAALPPTIEQTGDVSEKTIPLAIVGRPNVGKSSLVNRLIAEERCIVSPIAGTTRDAIDISIEKEGVCYTLIDTAGIRRKQKEREAVEKFSAIRTEQAIERAEICLLMIDAQVGITAQEKRILQTIESKGKGCCLLFNKWDLVENIRMEHCLRSLHEESPFLDHCPKLFTSAKTGRNLEKIFPLINSVAEARQQRIPTGELNRFIERTLQKNHPPMVGGKRLRIYYMVQVDNAPPRFVLFINSPDNMDRGYLRYLHNQFRKTYPFAGVPVTFTLRGKAPRGAAVPAL